VHGAEVAFQVVGDGDLDLVCVPPYSNVETRWDVPPIAHGMQRLASFARLISFDRRGTGVSDPIDIDRLAGWEHWAEDLVAVLDAAGSERAAILAEYESCRWGLLFAATLPERCRALVLWNPPARYLVDVDYPFGITPAEADELCATVGANWGTEPGTRSRYPSVEDGEVIASLARYERTACTPARMGRTLRWEFNLDVRAVLPSVRVPTLVLRRSTSFTPLEVVRTVADNVPGARYEEVPGEDAMWWAEGCDAICDLVQEFLTGAPPVEEPDRVLATVLITDIVGSTEHAERVGDRTWRTLLDAHDAVVDRQVRAQRGKVVKSTGDGVLATFDSPGRAVRCALQLGQELAAIGLTVRSGVHAGEVEVRGDDIGGIAVHIAARIEDRAAPGEVLVSRTVRDLVAGSSLRFTDRGLQELRGLGEAWQLFCASA
jgi:class 3 adenylate cyclase/pimeloyl-ACP methyl ester carboxylesterase